MCVTHGVLHLAVGRGVDELQKHLGQRFAAGPLPQLRERSLVQQPPVVQQAEPIAESLGFVQAVRADDDGLADVTQVPHVIKDHLAAPHIQAACRFVEQHDLRVVNQGPRQIDALLLAGAERRASLVQESREAELATDALDCLHGLIRRHMVEVRKEQQGLTWREPRIDAGTGRHQAEPRLDRIGHVRGTITAHLGVAGCRLQHAQDHPQRGRFPGPVGTEQTVDFPGRHAERQMIDRHDFRLAHREMLG